MLKLRATVRTSRSTEYFAKKSADVLPGKKNKDLISGLKVSRTGVFKAGFLR